MNNMEEDSAIRSAVIESSAPEFLNIDNNGVIEAPVTTPVLSMNDPVGVEATVAAPVLPDPAVVLATVASPGTANNHPEAIIPPVAAPVLPDPAVVLATVAPPGTANNHPEAIIPPVAAPVIANNDPQPILPILPPHIVFIREQLNGLTVEETYAIRRRFVLNYDVLSYKETEDQIFSDGVCMNDSRGAEKQYYLDKLVDDQLHLEGFVEVHSMNREERETYVQYPSKRMVAEVLDEIDRRIHYLRNNG